MVGDTEHFGKCSAPSRLEWQTNAFSNISKLLLDIDTVATLQELLLKGLKQL
jgi:hypothetical protein